LFFVALAEGLKGHHPKQLIRFFVQYLGDSRIPKSIRSKFKFFKKSLAKRTEKLRLLASDFPIKFTSTFRSSPKSAG
jgi:hypothetical protein